MRSYTYTTIILLSVWLASVVLLPGGIRIEEEEEKARQQQQMMDEQFAR